MIVANTKVYKNFQTAIPREIREKFNITRDTIVEWGINEDGEPTISFRDKVHVEDIIGLVKTDKPTNSVELKREMFRVDHEKQNRMF